MAGTNVLPHAEDEDREIGNDNNDAGEEKLASALHVRRADQFRKLFCLAVFRCEKFSTMTTEPSTTMPKSSAPRRAGSPEYDSDPVGLRQTATQRES